MNKIRIYLVNAFYSALIGAAVEVALALFSNEDAIYLSSLFNSMKIGIFIGTVSMFFLFEIFYKLKKKPIAGFISNFLVVAVIIGTVIAYNWIRHSFEFDLSWIYALVIAEVLSLILTAIWYREINLFNTQLEKKKASLK